MRFPSRLLAGLVVAGAFAGHTGLSVAADFSMPDDAPVISVTVPDEWHPQYTPVGLIGATDAPNQTNVGLDIVQKDNVPDYFKAEIVRLANLGIVIDPTKETKYDEQVNGIRYVWSLFDTTYQGNPEKYIFGVMEISDSSRLEVTFLSNQAGWDNKSYVVTDIVKSVTMK